MITSNITPMPVWLLADHPVLNGFPLLNPDAFEGLVDSAVEKGIQQPLLVTPIPEKTIAELEDQGRRERWWVYDGRNRRAVAARVESLGEAVPVAIKPISDDKVLAFALESAVIGRNLSKSAIALYLFDQHPELAQVRTKTGRPKKVAQIAPLSGEAEPEVDSFRKLAERYKVNREDFTRLASLRQRADDAVWEQIRHQILVEEAPISRLYAGYSTGQQPGSQRAAITWLRYSDVTGMFEGVMARPLKSLHHSFSGEGRKAYDELPLALKGAYAKAVVDTLHTLPEDLLTEIRRTLL